MTQSQVLARWIALLLPAALLAGVWGAQLIGHLVPCEMCHWQRWPHYAALVPALLAFAAPVRPARVLVALAALLIALSGAIGVFHAGVEHHWWNGLTGCSSMVDLHGLSAADRLNAIMNTPLVRCDTPQWTLLGISLAGFNAILSLGGAAAILTLMGRRR